MLRSPETLHAVENYSHRISSVSAYTCKLVSTVHERLDRKLADAIGSNTVEKCDVTLSRAIQRFARLMFPRIFHYLCLRLYILAMF